MTPNPSDTRVEPCIILTEIEEEAPDTLVDVERWAEWAEDEIVTKVAARPAIVVRRPRPYRNF